MMSRLSVFGVLVLASLLAPATSRAQSTPAVAPPASTAVPAACDAPADLGTNDTRLPHVANALGPNKTLRILAVGSATMMGPGGGPEGSFPYRMVQLLRAAVPGATIQLDVHSGRGLTATDMLTTITTELHAHPAQLVLWQTGTVEAVRNLPPEDFFQTLSDGVSRAHAANADLILIDPQFSRFLHANASLDQYEQTMAQVAGQPDVVLFRRFDLMRHWVDSGQIDLERVSRADRQKTADLLHECLGRGLAQVILQGAAAKAP